MVEILLDSGADVNEANIEDTALHCAAQVMFGKQTHKFWIDRLFFFKKKNNLQNALDSTPFIQ